MQTTELFGQLIQVAIGTRNADDFSGATEQQWTDLLAIARKQGVIAVCFGGIEKLAREKQPPLRTKLHWIGLVDLIVKQNEKITALCKTVTEEMKSVGVSSCILKGQGMATYYPTPLYRNSGDIDLWIQLDKPTDNFEADVKEMLKRITTIGRGEPTNPGPHHAEWSADGVEVELHYRPGEFYNKKIDRKYKQFGLEEFKNNRPTDAGFYIPTTYFNMVQQMEHLQRHLLFEGIGMRQLCDYAILLLSSTEEERKRAAKTLRELNLKRPAAALMWVIKHIFGIPDERLLFTPNEKLGRMALQDAMDFGGNMAHQRYHMPKEQFNALSNINKFRYMLHERKHTFKYAPREAFAELCYQINVIISRRK